MRIRDADPERDGRRCAGIYRPYVTDSAISFELDAPDAAEMARRIRDTQRSHPWLVAEREGTVVGYAYAAPHRARAAYRWACDVSVYVAREEHGRGIGRSLYAELLERLRRQGFRTACAGITLPNPISVRLHESAGFRPVGTYRAIGWKQGAWHDTGWWQLDLVEPTEERPREPGPP